METISTNSSSATSGQQQQQQQQHPNHRHQQRADNKTNDESTSTLVEPPSESSPKSEQQNNMTTLATSNSSVVYDVEHLATFSTNSSGNQNTSGEVNNRTTASISGSSNDDNDENNSKALSAIGTTANDSATPKVALQRLFELEKLSGIWTQHMQIELRDDYMLIVDCETNSTVERFNRDCVTRPEAFNHYNDIYNNIVVFIIQQPNNNNNGSTTSDSNQERKLRKEHQKSKESGIEGENYQDFGSSSSSSSSAAAVDSCAERELHIFQCVSHKAQQLVSDILNWKSVEKLSNNQTMPTTTNSQSPSSKQGQKNSLANRNSTSINNNHKTAEFKKSSPLAAHGSGKPVVTVASSTNSSENVPIVNVNVKETVQVFNQIAALREKSKPTSPVNHTRPLSDASGTSAHSTPVGSASATSNGAHDSPAVRSPLSPGSSSQLYKQRSIRATLAPKYASGGSPAASAHSSPANSAKMEPPQASSSASSSSADSSEAKLAYKLAGPSTSRHQGEPSSVRDAMEAQPTSVKQSAANSSGLHQAPSGQHKAPKSQHKAQQQQQHQQQARTQTKSSNSHASSSSQSHLDQVTTNESYVSVLNHCFDDIEKFIIRLQQAVAAIHELQTKRKLTKRSSQTGGKGSEPGGSGGYTKGVSSGGVSSPPMSAAELAMLSSKARGPSEDDYFEILSKFKLAFNLLAKLKGCIHEPNAPELVHFLFTPLAIIIESARNATPPVDPTLVGIPYLNQDALDLLSNCCTSKESDMWISLGPNWTQTIDMNLLKASRLPSSFQPIFSDGWAPIIGELELIGLVAPGSLSTAEQITPAEVIDSNNHHHHSRSHDGRRAGAGGGGGHTGYMLDDQGGPSTANSYSLDHTSFSNGKGKPRGTEVPSHAISGRDHNKRASALLPPNNNRHLPGPLKHIPPQQPYIDHQINQVPYGYPLVDPHPNMESEMHGAGHRLGPEHSRNIRFSTTAEGQVPRRAKQSSSYQNYSMTPNYDAAHYPPMSILLDDDSHLEEVDMIAHQNGSVSHHHHHSDDYSELQEHYVEDGRNHKGMPGPSHHHYSPENGHSRHNLRLKNAPSTIYNRPSVLPPFETDYMNEADHEAMLHDLGPAQTEWFFELQSRGATIVRVLFTRDANNDKELSVRRGEILEVLDDTRKWWRTRNIDLQVAHVPHTIVAVMQGYQTLDELLANSPGNMDESSRVNPQRFSRRNLPLDHNNQHQWHARDEKRNSKTAGAFRYF